MRVVLDVNVVVSATLSRSGAPARLIQLWLDGVFDIVVCPMLVAEVERALTYPRISARMQPADVEEVLRLLRDEAESVSDPDRPPPVRSADPKDDYLLALAAREQVMLVSGDEHLLALGSEAPLLSPRAFLDTLES